MKSLTLLLLLCCTCARAQSARPAESPSLPLRFAPVAGDFLRITLSERETDTKLDKTAYMAFEDPVLDKFFASLAPRKQTIVAKTIGFDWRIQDRDAEGNTVIAASYAFIRVEFTLGREVKASALHFGAEEVVNPGARFVFDTRQEILANNPMLEALDKQPASERPSGAVELYAMLEWARGTLNRAIVGRPFMLVVSPQGKLLAVQGMEVIMDHYRSEMSKRETQFAVRAQQDALIESFFGEDTVNKTMTLSLLLPYPARAVRPGDSWSDHHEFEVAGLKMSMVRTMTLDAGPDVDGQVPLSGSMEIASRKDGWVIDSRQASWSMTAEVNAATGMYRTLDAEDHVDLTARGPGARSDAPPVTVYDRPGALGALSHGAIRPRW